jgi:hypothetical protein
MQTVKWCLHWHSHEFAVTETVTESEGKQVAAEACNAEVLPSATDHQAFFLIFDFMLLWD